MHPPVRPWYKEFWPWFLLGILAMAVIMGTTTLVLSITSFDGMVVDNYYKKGLAINRVLEQDKAARELGQRARLRIDDVTGDVTVTLEGDARPERLRLALLFPTQGGRDRHITLRRLRGGHYSGQLPSALRYRWYVQLHPDVADPAWRLIGEIHLPQTRAQWLAPHAEAP